MSTNAPSQPPSAASVASRNENPPLHSEPDRYATSGDSNPSVPTDSPAESPTAVTEATTVSATEVGDAPPLPSINTRQAAWLLGSKLSLAALAHDRGIAPEEVPAWLKEAHSMADSLQVALADLPAPPATSQADSASREVLSYLLDQGKTIGAQLAVSHGPEQAALFEMAMKSNLLLVLNKPGSTAVNHISNALATVAPRSGLPTRLWQPLLDLLANGSPPAAVRTAVRQMHADVEAHLAAAVEQ